MGGGAYCGAATKTTVGAAPGEGARIHSLAASFHAAGAAMHSITAASAPRTALATRRPRARLRPAGESHYAAIAPRERPRRSAQSRSQEQVTGSPLDTARSAMSEIVKIAAAAIAALAKILSAVAERLRSPHHEASGTTTPPRSPTETTGDPRRPRIVAVRPRSARDVLKRPRRIAATRSSGVGAGGAGGATES
jgi:hypothetical protein